jgi:hypothetical protein
VGQALDLAAAAAAGLLRGGRGCRRSRWQRHVQLVWHGFVYYSLSARLISRDLYGRQSDGRGGVFVDLDHNPAFFG